VDKNKGFLAGQPDGLDDVIEAEYDEGSKHLCIQLWPFKLEAYR
jgi:hypothetical protein